MLMMLPIVCHAAAGANDADDASDCLLRQQPEPIMLMMLAIVCCQAAGANDADDAFRLFAAMRQPESMMLMMLPIVCCHAAAGANDADDASDCLLPGSSRNQ